MTWKRTLTGPDQWTTAGATCASWLTGGRVPTLDELNALVQAAMSCASKITWPAPDPGQAVWTSTPDPMNSTFHYMFYFDGTPAISAPEGDQHWVVCVK